MDEQEYNDFIGNEIAIIGMSCRVPGARNPDQFWQNVRDGVESIRPYTDDELRAAGVSEKLLNHPNYVKRGASIDGMEQFDPKFFNMRPREAQVMDPQHRHFLECAWEALEDATYDPADFDGLIGVFGGSGHNIYFSYNVLTNQSLVDSEGFFLLRHTGNDKDFLTTRVSYAFNLKGPSVNVQTACSTSLVAIHMATQSLNQMECDIALAGGVTIELPHRQGYVYQENEILSPDGHCRAFSSDSEGTVFGSGVGVVALRRLQDAIEADDPILGVILSTAINNDGSDKASYLAPSPEGQALAISEALQVAEVDADTITYVEAHGTGTSLGDPIEIQGLTQAFRHSTDETQFCGIGSVKTNIGHLDTAAGVISFIKTIQALRHKQLPPSLNFDKPNSMIDFENSPFYVNDQLQDWVDPEEFPRRAGVSSLGVGGTNAHVLLQEAPERPSSGPSARRYKLLTLSGLTMTSVDGNSSRMAEFLREDQHGESLADVAYTTQVGRRAFMHRRAVVARDATEMAQVLDSKDRHHVATLTASEEAPEIVFMFPGGGAQYPGMGQDLYEQEPLYRQILDECFAIVRGQIDVDLKSLMFGEGGEIALQRPSLSLPAIFMTEYALAQLWLSWGIEPKAMIGHSMGEYTAACLSGVLSLKDALSIVTLRGKLFETLPDGGMISVSLMESELRELLVDGASIAVINNPEICVVSGQIEAIEAMKIKLDGLGISYRGIPIKVAAHSPMLEPILEKFEAHMRTIRFSSPKIPYISNVTGRWIEAREATDPSYWVRHLRQTVRYSDGLSTLLTDSTKLLLEVGPGQVLSGLLRAHPKKMRQHTAVSSMRHVRETTPDDQQLLLALGQAWAAGLKIDWAMFYGEEKRHRIHLPTYAFDHDRYWIEPGKQLFTAEPSSRDSLTKQPDMADWYYRPEWRHDRMSLLETEAVENETWLIFADDVGLSEMVQHELVGRKQNVITVFVGERYEQSGQNSFRLRPNRKDDYGRLIQTLSEQNRMPAHVGHFWTVYRASEDAKSPRDAYTKMQTLGFSSLVYLSQAIGDVEYSEPLMLNVCTNGLQKIGREKIGFPEKSIILGPCRVIPREYPNIQVKLVDVKILSDSRRNWLSILYDEHVSSPREVPLENTAKQLVAEFSVERDEPLVAYRNTGRWVSEIRPFPITKFPETENKIRHQGVYLITGGLGGIGLTLATHLASTYHARLVLLSRTNLPPRREWAHWLKTHAPTHRTSHLIQQIQQLEELGGEVLYVRTDVTELTDVERSIRETIDRFGKIHGVIHAAGVIDDDLIQIKDLALARRVMAPKVLGTLNLHEALSNNHLDFMVLFSSTSTVLAPAGQVDYVAANAFLNTFADAYEGDRYDSLVSLNWGVWQEVGMAAASLRGEAERIHGRDMPHPWLGQLVVESPQKLEYVMDYRVDDLWFLSEHRIKQGQALIPGTGYLELASGALAQEHMRTAVHIRDLFFLMPLSVADNQATRVHVSLVPQEFGAEYTFSVASEAQNGFLEHARGSISSLRDNAPQALLIDQIKDRCRTGGYVFYAPLGQETKQEAYLDFGLRWKNLREIFLGNGESLARLELPTQFHDDMDTFMLHPALMDLATTHGLLLLDGYDEDDGLYVPFLYHSLKSYSPLPSRIFSHVRLRQPVSVDMPSFDITITDQNGRVLVDIEGFTMKRVSHSEMVTQQARSSSEDREGSNGFLEKTIRAGILPTEGVSAFTRVLSHDTGSQVIVSSISIEALQDSMQADLGDISSANGLSVDRPSNLSSEYAEPTNEIERMLSGYWENFIGVSPIGIHDDFFELGGHSLIAVRFFTRIKKQYKVDLSLATLFETPTIAQCAQRIMDELGIEDSSGVTAKPIGMGDVSRDRWTPIVKINSGVDGKTPFFCIHGAGGNVLNFQALAQHIGGDRPFYGVQAQGVDGVLPPLSSLKEMADLYLPEIRRIQPNGPYLLGGYSGGGVVAYELAQRLTRSGETVELVAFLDSFHPVIDSRKIPIREHLREIQSKGIDYIRDRLAKREKRRSDAAKSAASLAYVEAHPGEVVPFEHREPYLVHTFINALKGYEPKPYTGRVVQLSAGDTWIMYKHSGSDRGWGQLVPQLEVQVTPGDHDTIVSEPNVQVLATHLRRLLDKS